MTQTVITIVIVLALVILFFWMVPLRLWFIAILNGVHVSLFDDYGLESGHQHQS